MLTFFKKKYSFLFRHSKGVQNQDIELSSNPSFLTVNQSSSSENMEGCAIFTSNVANNNKVLSEFSRQI